MKPKPNSIMETTKDPNDKLTGWLNDLKSKQATLPQKDEQALIDEVLKANNDWTEHADYVRDLGRHPLISALTAGYALQALKQKHTAQRDWVAFLKGKLPDLSQATVYRYLKLAERYPDPKAVPIDMSISTAYRLAGVLPEGGSKSLKKSSAVKMAKSSGRKPAALIKSMNSLATNLSESLAAWPVDPRNCKALADGIHEIILQLGKVKAGLISRTAVSSGPARPEYPEVPIPLGKPSWL
jgi:hypothetical protein